MNKCKCGCGLEPNIGKSYIQGHYIRTNSPVDKPSNRRKISIANTGKTKSETHRKNLSVSMRGKRTHLGYKHTPETKLKISAKLMGNQNCLGRRCNYKISKESRHAISLACKEYYTKNLSKHTKQVIIGNHRRPTNPEQILIDIISDYGLPYNYNGNNGKVVIDGLCPDFIHKTQPIVVLVNGIYWHNNPERELEILNRYKNRGFKVLTLTDREIYSNPDDYLMFLLITKGCK